MLRRIYTVVLITAVFTSITQPSSAQNKSIQEVDAAVQNLTKAMLAPDGRLLDELVVDELTYGHSSGKVETKAEFITTLTSGASVFEKIDITAQTIKIVENTAVVRHTLQAKTNDPGKGPADIKLGIVLTWVKVNQHWQLLARQAFKLP